MVYGYEVKFKDVYSTMIQDGQYAIQVNMEKNKKQVFGYRLYANVIRV
jgi:hypothetical protein